jgi:hypothetical protein
MHCWILVALLLSAEIANAIGSTKVFNVTESPHDDIRIPRFPSDVDNEAVLRDYVVLRDWFVAPPLLSTTVAASDHIHSPRCRNQSRIFLQELRNFTLWAVQSEYSMYSLLEIIYFRFRYALIVLIFFTSRWVGICKADITHIHTTIYYVLSVDNVATCFENYVVIFRPVKYIRENYSCKFIFV